MQSVHAEKNTTPQDPTRLRVLSGPVRISVAYGNIPAPGLQKVERRSQESLRIVCDRL